MLHYQQSVEGVVCSSGLGQMAKSRVASFEGKGQAAIPLTIREGHNNNAGRTYMSARLRLPRGPLTGDGYEYMAGGHRGPQ